MRIKRRESLRHDYSRLIGVALGGITFACAPVVDAGETKAPERVNYARPFEPPTRPAFLPLPPGAVEPAGWLRDWCLAARDGYTGHMDEYGPSQELHPAVEGDTVSFRVPELKVYDLVLLRTERKAAR